MKQKNNLQLGPYNILSLSGIIAVIFYFCHIIAGRLVWTNYNPLTQPISDLTAMGALSQPISSKILWGYQIFNLIFCVVLLLFFKKYPINRTFYRGLILKTLAEVLSTVGYTLFPLSNTAWENSFQNTMHYTITGIIVFSYIICSVLLARGLYKFGKHPKMARFLIIFSIVFILSGFLTVVAAQALPDYVGLIERINLYSLMTLNVMLALWIRTIAKNHAPL